MGRRLRGVWGGADIAGEVGATQIAQLKFSHEWDGLGKHRSDEMWTLELLDMECSEMRGRCGVEIQI